MRTSAPAHAPGSAAADPRAEGRLLHVEAAVAMRVVGVDPAHPRVVLLVEVDAVRDHADADPAGVAQA